MKRYLAGKIVKAHGIAGELKVTFLTNTPEDFLRIKKIRIKDIEYEVKSSRVIPDGIIIKLIGVNSRTQAEQLIDDIWVDSENMPQLSKGQYYIVDLLGSDIVTENKVLGILVDIQQFGPIDTYVVKGNKNFAFPALKEKIIKKIDLENHRIIVDFDELEQVALYED